MLGHNNILKLFFMKGKKQKKRQE